MTRTEWHISVGNDFKQIENEDSVQYVWMELESNLPQLEPQPD